MSSVWHAIIQRKSYIFRVIIINVEKSFFFLSTPFLHNNVTVWHTHKHVHIHKSSRIYIFLEERKARHTGDFHIFQSTLRLFHHHISCPLIHNNNKREKRSIHSICPSPIMISSLSSTLLQSCCCCNAIPKKSFHSIITTATTAHTHIHHAAVIYPSIHPSIHPLQKCHF